MGIDTHAQLAPVLTPLKLTGMLDTLDARLAEARAGTLGHVEFLQTLCEDELARRDAAAVSRRPRRPPPGRGHPGRLRLLLQPQTSRRPDPRPGPAGVRRRRRRVCIYGPVGVGKTHLAAALAHQACRRG